MKEYMWDSVDNENAVNPIIRGRISLIVFCYLKKI